MARMIRIEVDNLGSSLRLVMETRGISQSSLARRSGVSQSAISRILSGQRRVQFPTVKNLADALGMTVAELYEAKTRLILKKESSGCACGSKECGLVWISAEGRYQCGFCIQKTYAKVAQLKDSKKEMALSHWHAGLVCVAADQAANAGSPGGWFG